MSRYGILKVYFDAFSSKKRRGTTPANIYEQFCYADFIHFSFTGKERDEETGYGYFGARYMDYSLMTSFISVDRYASKYPFISPYAYCAWNPIRLIDPTGDTIVIMGGNSRNDWMAVYRENLIRQQLKQPLRTHYSKKLEPDLRNELRVTGGSGTFMLNDGKPYLPQW